MDSNLTPQSLSNQAIDAAMDCRWEEALKLNKKIIKDDPKNIDALNRQARVYMEMGKLSLAKKWMYAVSKRYTFDFEYSLFLNDFEYSLT